MDPSPLPTEENAIGAGSDAPIENTLASADRFWLHRTLLGVSGLAIAQLITMAGAAGALLNLIAMGAENRTLERLLGWIWHLQDVAYAVQWFSALYLLALAPYSREGEDPYR